LSEKKSGLVHFQRAQAQDLSIFKGHRPRACPFSKGTGPGLVYEKCFLGAL